MRIRTIKPAFWSSANVARVSRDARLLFIGLWNDADDHGRLLGSPKRLSGVLFAHDEDVGPREVDAWLSELEAVGLISRYEVSGVRYVEIPGFREHQKIDRRSAPHHPGMAEAEGGGEDEDGEEAPAEIPPMPANIPAGPAEIPPMPAEIPPVDRRAPPECGGRKMEDGRWKMEDGESAAKVAAPIPLSLPANEKPIRIVRRGRGVIGLQEAEGRPPTPRDLPPDKRAELGRDFPALDGKNGRASLPERLTALWPNYLENFDAHGPEVAWAKLRGWLGDRTYQGWRRDWERERSESPGSGQDEIWREWRTLKDDRARDVPPLAEYRARREGGETADQIAPPQRYEDNSKTAYVRVRPHRERIYDHDSNAPPEGFAALRAAGAGGTRSSGGPRRVGAMLDAIAGELADDGGAE